MVRSFLVLLAGFGFGTQAEPVCENYNYNVSVGQFVLKKDFDDDFWSGPTDVTIGITPFKRFTHWTGRTVNRAHGYHFRLVRNHQLHDLGIDKVSCPNNERLNNRFLRVNTSPPAELVYRVPPLYRDVHLGQDYFSFVLWGVDFDVRPRIVRDENPGDVSMPVRHREVYTELTQDGSVRDDLQTFVDFDRGGVDLNLSELDYVPFDEYFAHSECKMRKQIRMVNQREIPPGVSGFHDDHAIGRREHVDSWWMPDSELYSPIEVADFEVQGSALDVTIRVYRRCEAPIQNPTNDRHAFEFDVLEQLRD